MPVLYSELGTHRKLNEIIIAGSHDAGITTGGKNAQTQALDILGQANAGVRFFDIRIAAFKTGEREFNGFGAKKVELKSFHADDLVHKKETKLRHVVGRATGELTNLERSKLRGGTQGLGLTKILQDARTFVENGQYSSEFLILKFDKCTNWNIVADMCRDVLGDKIYSDGGNLNTKTLGELAGKVIVAFMPGGYRELMLPAQKLGITPIVNLYKPPAGYDPNFNGLQYWGAGGTKINSKSDEAKIEENITTQGNILARAGTNSTNPNVLGMMYWTTTGVFRNIRERNSLMWNAENKPKLSQLWRDGMQSYLRGAIANNVNLMSFASGATMKIFMPNIVMIDFSDQEKCQHIYDLNNLPATTIVDTLRALNGVI